MLSGIVVVVVIVAVNRRGRDLARDRVISDMLMHAAKDGVANGMIMVMICPPIVAIYEFAGTPELHAYNKSPKNISAVLSSYIPTPTRVAALVIWADAGGAPPY